MNLYNQSKVPIEHLETFKAHMMLQWFSGEIACRAFPLTIKGTAKRWFESLRNKVDHEFQQNKLTITHVVHDQQKEEASCLPYYREATRG